MKRKVIQLAGKTLVVSLPSKWAKKYNIRKGDEIELKERGREIIIKTETESGVERIQLDTKGINERVIRWALSGLHKSGYDEIEILYDKPETINIVQELIKDLFVGFVIINQTNAKCLLKSISKDSETEFDVTLRRAFLVTITMGENALELIKNKELSSLKTLLSLEKTNNQLTNFCERLLNKKGYPDHRKTCFFYVITWNLEKICDDYKYICEFLSQPDNKNVVIGKEIINFFWETNNFLKEYYNLFYKLDMNKLSDLGVKRKELVKKGRELFKTKTEAEIVVIDALIDLILKVVDFSASTIAINQEQTASYFD